MNGYELTRNWFDFKFENPSKVRAIHTDFYIYILDQWNRLGQKKEFGLPTSYTMECLGIGSYNTYKKTLTDLVDFGFVKIIKDSKNQHVSKIIALSKFDKAIDKPSDKALDEANIKAIDKPTDTIVKQYNNLTIEQIKNILNFYNSLSKAQIEKRLKQLYDSKFDFEQCILDLGADVKITKDWMQVRKDKKATNSETAFNGFLREFSKSGKDINTILKICVEKSWKGFENEWLSKIKFEDAIIEGETEEEKDLRIRRESFNKIKVH